MKMMAEKSIAKAPTFFRQDILEFARCDVSVLFAQVSNTICRSKKGDAQQKRKYLLEDERNQHSI
jgi:hypothetical protein